MIIFVDKNDDAFSKGLKNNSDSKGLILID